MKDRISRDKIKKYMELTEKALGIAKKSVLKKKEAEEIIRMVSDYLSDSEYFEKSGDFVNAFAAINYAHGWLDSGARLGIFKVKDNKLFTIE